MCLWVWCCRDNYSVGESCVIQAQIVSSSFNEFVAGKSVQQSLIWFLANSERYQDQTSVVCWHFSFFVQKILHLICKNRLFNELLREEPVDGWMSKQNLFHQIFKQYFCFHIETTWVPLIKCTLSLENISKKSFNLFLFFFFSWKNKVWKYYDQSKIGACLQSLTIDNWFMLYKWRLMQLFKSRWRHSECHFVIIPQIFCNNTTETGKYFCYKMQIIFHSCQT